MLLDDCLSSHPQVRLHLSPVKIKKLKKKRPFIKRGPSELAQTTNEHPQVDVLAV